MQTELISALEETAATQCSALILTGTGEAFCSGLDLSELQTMRDKTPAEHHADAERVARLLVSLYELPLPTIAAVNGPAIAGGTGLATLCDFTLATPAAKFGFTEVRIGFVPALVSAFLSLQIGDKRSRDLLLTGRLFGATEAQQLGLVNEIVEREELVARAHALARALIANSPQALSATKRLLAEENRAWLDAAIVAALKAHAESRETADFREGITAFLDKRKPEWKSRC
jgi:methylglutaconyl-CoA hydratase